jgi:hypothetical protein
MAAAPTLPDLSRLVACALWSLLLAHHERLLSGDRKIEHLKLIIAKLRRMAFGVESKQVTHTIEQLELKLEEPKM